MLLPSVFSSLHMVLTEKYVTEVLKTNEKCANYGLTLSHEDAKKIISARNRALGYYGRIEVDIEVTKALISSFSSSSFLDQDSFVALIQEMHEVFYYLKNETEDKIGDEQLIAELKNMFENKCAGSIELLKGRELDMFIRSFRHMDVKPDAFTGGGGINGL